MDIIKCEQKGVIMSLLEDIKGQLKSDGISDKELP